MLQDILLSLKEAKEFITTLAGSAWNGFFENIWKKRCELITLWEKSVGITAVDKRKREESMSGKKSNNKKTHEKVEGKDIDQSNRTKVNKKEEDSNSIQKVWLGSVSDWISNRVRPFFWGLSG